MKEKKYTRTIENVRILKEWIGFDHFSMQDFWFEAGFTPEELKEKTRRWEIVEVRQVGVAWAVLSGHTLKQAADMFDQNHSTALYSIDSVMNTLIYPGMYPDQYQLLMQICRRSHSSMLSKDLNVGSLRIMDVVIAPLLDIKDPSDKARSNLIQNRINQLKISA